MSTNAWRNALKPGWRIHNGTPLYDLQEMGGWKSAAMVRRYAHLAPAQMGRHRWGGTRR